MTSALRTFTRLVTVVAVVMAYVALHLAITAGMDLRARDRFREAPTRAAAFVAALDRYAGGDVSARAEIGEVDAWFEENAPSGASRSAVSSATGDVQEGRVSLARERVAGLAVQVEQEQAGLDRDLNSSDTVALWLAVTAGVLVVPALRLRRRRRSGAADVVEVVGQFAPRQPWWRRPVFLAASGVGYGLFTAGFLAVSTAQRQGYKMTLAAQVLLLPCGLAALGAGILVLRYTRPRSAGGAVQALLADGRRPVLYLRSFNDDDSAARVDDVAAVNIHSREEQLAGALGTLGPVIAVGRPGEPLPRLGAARFYLPLDDWQPVVLRLMELSQLIVLRLGLGEGLWWEVEQARATQPARKLVLLAPGQLPGVAERLDEVLPAPSRLDKVIAGDSWISAVIVFDPEWTPQVHPVGTVPGATPRRGRLARVAARVKASGLASMTTYAPTHHVVRAMKAALASVGVRKRTMVLRGNLATQAALWRGILLLTALGLLGWLVFRALQLFGAW
ncbi:transferase [Streptantibioticus ferralitis]|uniref:Transferase n=1 Tax=Streptantibioticus ferralitis TaxID=236510 RepID=A0ABT5ZB88_9ACTN|nr:transferase [Streptantibioticus ferralitis]MDF2261100.1 transferase [Streptantibioticus ferralitis]